MKRLPFFLISLILLCAFGCSRKQDRVSQNENASFFGDSVLTILSSDRPNEYSISILKNKDLCLWRFQRGDSIDRYLALDRLPYKLEAKFCDSIGVVSWEFDIQTTDSLNGDCFFMDVNFDGEAEFVMAQEGFNRTYYNCFDLVNGKGYDPSTGLLWPMDESPYNNIVGGMCGETTFDYKNQTIYIFENMGWRDYTETWARPMESEYEAKLKVRIFKKTETVFDNEGFEYATEYGLVNDTLKEVSHRKRLAKSDACQSHVDSGGLQTFEYYCRPDKKS